jgi:hypothetical protein
VSWSGIAFIVESPVARGRAFAALARGDRAFATSLFDEVRIPLDPIARSGRTRSPIPEDPIT